MTTKTTSTRTTRTRTSRRTFLQNVWGGVKEILIIAVMALVLSFIVKTWLIQAFYIPSGSMEDTLVRDDRVIVSKLTPGPFDLDRGDVVVFEDPGDWLGTVPESAQSGTRESVRHALQFVGLLPDDSDDHLIKRVIGLPGDHVVCCDEDGQLTINGVSITEPYIKPGDTPERRQGELRHHGARGARSGSWATTAATPVTPGSTTHGRAAQGSVPINDITGRAVMIVGRSTT